MEFKALLDNLYLLILRILAISFILRISEIKNFLVIVRFSVYLILFQTDIDADIFVSGITRYIII